jgi:hypothetical protein
MKHALVLRRLSEARETYTNIQLLAPMRTAIVTDKIDHGIGITDLATKDENATSSKHTF